MREGAFEILILDGGRHALALILVDGTARGFSNRMKNNTVDSLLIGLLVISATALAWLVYSSMHQTIIEAGDKAPNFHITTDEGRQVSVKDFCGRVLVLNFWATWCEPCVEEAPSLNQLAKQTAPSGVVVLGVSIDKNQRLYEQFRQRFHLVFQTYRDPDAEIPASYGTFKIPETYIINREGKVVRKVISNYDWADPEMIRFVTSL